MLPLINEQKPGLVIEVLKTFLGMTLAPAGQSLSYIPALHRANFAFEAMEVLV